MSEEQQLADRTAQQEEGPAAARPRRWMIGTLLGVLLALGGGTLVYVIYESEYEASAWIQIHEKPPYIAFEPNEPRERSQLFAETQIELVRSPLVLAPVLNAKLKKETGQGQWIETEETIATLPEIKNEEDRIKWLVERISVNKMGQSDLFRISFRHSDPLNAARIANAITDAYLLLRNQRDDGHTQRVLELLDEQRERLKQEVERLHDQVRHLTKQATGTDPYAAPSAAETGPNLHLTDLQSRLTTAEVEGGYLRSEIRAFEEGAAKQQIEVPDRIVQQRIEHDALIQELKRLIAQKQLKLFEAETATRGVDSDPAVTRLKEEIQRWEAKLAQVRSDLFPKIKAQIAQTIVNQRNDELAEMKAKRDSYDDLKKVLRERLEAERAKIIVGTGETLELKFAENELARAEDVLDRIASRAMMLRTEQNAPARITLLRHAETPTAPVASPYKKMALVSLSGLCLPFVLLVLWTGFVYVRAKMTEKRVTPAAP